MWNWFNCYLSGRHDYGMWCEPRAIFLRCVHCGRRSGGWALDAKPQTVATALKPTAKATQRASQVLPFDRQAALR
ncbi:MAG: hypothetical protein EXQ59_05970 [Acidobacteria bacterium]|nr:hypothetical protein [Acidobacteriota bacterium]